MNEEVKEEDRQNSDQIGHLLSRCLTGSIDVDNLILQNSGANNRLSSFDSCLANILVSHDSNRADMFWKFIYKSDNRTKRPDTVRTFVKLSVKEEYSTCIEYSYENRVGKISQLVGLNRETNSLSRRIPPSSTVDIVLPEFVTQIHPSFSSFKDAMRLKYPSFTKFEWIQPGEKGAIMPNIIWESEKRCLFHAEYTIKDKSVCVIVWREVMFVYLLVVLPGYPAKGN